MPSEGGSARQQAACEWRVPIITHVSKPLWPCNRWVAEGSLIYMENVRDVTLLPDNSFTNKAGCRLGNYEQPIALGKNSHYVIGPHSLMRT